MPREPQNIADHIIALLTDGEPRTASQIGVELEEKIHRSFHSIVITVSTRIAHDRRVQREKLEGRYVYRFVGVV